MRTAMVSPCRHFALGHIDEHTLRHLNGQGARDRPTADLIAAAARQDDPESVAMVVTLSCCRWCGGLQTEAVKVIFAQTVEVIFQRYPAYLANAPMMSACWFRLSVPYEANVVISSSWPRFWLHAFISSMVRHFLCPS
jgi:hypothetical protein